MWFFGATNPKFTPNPYPRSALKPMTPKNKTRQNAKKNICDFNFFILICLRSALAWPRVLWKTLFSWRFQQLGSNRKTYPQKKKDFLPFLWVPVVDICHSYSRFQSWYEGRSPFELTKNDKIVAGVGQRRVGQKRWMTEVQQNDIKTHKKAKKQKATDIRDKVKMKNIRKAEELSDRQWNTSGRCWRTTNI